MKTTATFSDSGMVNREALFSEIAKLAAAPQKPEDSPRKKAIKQFMKNYGERAAAYAGFETGSFLAGYLADKGIEKLVGSEKYQNMPKAARLKVILPLLGLAGIAASYTRYKGEKTLHKKYQKK